jgi:hypothetical protein
MMLQRTYASNPQGAQAYRNLLMQDADIYGLDREQIARMKQPVLVRHLADAATPTPQARQAAITDFNVKGTADLTPAEKAMSDSRRISEGTQDDVSRRMDALGPSGTLSQVLAGSGGVDVLNNMIRDGVINQAEVAAYKAGDSLTPAGKARIAEAFTGRFYRDPDQINNTALPVRSRVERIAGPLTKLDADPKWTLTPTVRGALTLIEDAQAHGNNLSDFLNTPDLLGKPAYPAPVAQMAKYLKAAPLPVLKDAVEIYARDAATDAEPEGMFGKPEVPAPEASFTRAMQVAKLNAEEAKQTQILAKMRPREELSDSGWAAQESKAAVARKAIEDVRAKRAAL